MTGAALALLLALRDPLPPAPPPPWYGGRVLSSSTLHIGVRPALDIDKSGDVAVGVTVQITAFVP